MTNEPQKLDHCTQCADGFMFPFIAIDGRASGFSCTHCGHTVGKVPGPIQGNYTKDGYHLTDADVQAAGKLSTVIDDYDRLRDRLLEFKSRLDELNQTIQDNRGKIDSNFWDGQMGVISNVVGWFSDLGLDVNNES